MHVSTTMETQYDLSEYPACEKSREGRSPKAPMFVMNHFYKYEPIPGARLIADFDRVNEYDELLKRVSSCFYQENQWPNFIAVDNVGSKKGGERAIVIDINNRNISLSNPRSVVSIINPLKVVGVCATAIAGIGGLLYYCYRTPTWQHLTQHLHNK